MSVDLLAALEARAQRAEDLWRSGDFASALAEYTATFRERLLSAGLTLTAADMVVAERVSDLALLFGHAEAADDLLAGVAARVEQSGSSFWADFIQTKRIDLALGRGLLREASDILSGMCRRIGDVAEIDFSPAGLARWESRCHWPQTDNSDRTVILTFLYLSMGRILSALGQYGDAASALNRGLSLAEAEGTHDLARRAVSPLNLALAGVLLEKGDLPEAGLRLTALETALDPARQPGWFVRRLELGGKLCLLTGDFGGAIEKFRSTLTICERYRFEKAALAASVNLAHALIYLNQTAEARRTLEDVSARARAKGDKSTAARADALLSVAQARGASLADTVAVAPTVTEHWGFSVNGLAADAPPAAAEHSLDLPQSDNFLALYEDRALEFFWMLGRRGPKAAAPFLAGMGESFQYSDSLLIRERLRVLDAVLAYYEEDYRRAETLLGRAYESLRQLGLTPELWQMQRLLGWCMVKLGRPQEMCDRLAAESARLLDEMTASLPHEERAVFLLNKWTAEEEYIAGEANHLARLKLELEAAPWWRRPALRWRLWRRLDGLIAYIDRYKQRVARRTVRGEEATDDDATHTSLARRLWQRPRGEVTISFLILPDRVLIIRAGWLSLDFGVSAATRLQVREFVQRWHGLVRDIVEGSRGLGALPGSDVGRGKPVVGSIEREVAEVVDGLVSVLQLSPLLNSLPKRVSSLTIVPDDSLHGFPFAAIRHKGDYLIEHFALTYAFEHDARPSAGGDDCSEALAVGVSEGTREFPPLPCVKEELDMVAAWLGRQHIPEEGPSEAAERAGRPNKALLLEHLPQVAFAHIACHGVFRPDLPDHSGVVLLSSLGQPEVLSVRELSTLNLRKLKHVTLSSCWSADHFILPGRWVISLPETLWRAGTDSILGCLWLVNDHVGMKFMTRFYYHLNPLSRQEALRQAQRDCLHGELEGVGEVDTRHPIYWAGYQLYGANSDLRL